MPRGPKGEKRPADVIGAAVMIGRIATGEIEDTSNAAKVLGRKGGEARARKLSAAERKAIASKAATQRWKKSPSARGAKERS
jgi:hypothetical protein